MTSLFKVEEFVSKAAVFDTESVRSFATITGDMSPLHHDARFSSSTRFGGLIVSGGQLSSWMMGMVATFLTERQAGLGLEFDFKFRKAIAAGEPFRAEWKIVSIETSTKLGGDLIELEGSISNSKDEICVTAFSKSLSFPIEAFLIS